MNYMDLAIMEARKGISNGEGGPFGAVIIKDGEVISSAHNTVLKDKDATCHAEVNAIRLASKKLGTHDLSGCTLYTTSEPCPMCLSAVIWSNIKTIYYGSNRKDVANIGFRDDFIYNYFNNNEMNILNIRELNREDCKKVLEEYKDKIY